MAEFYEKDTKPKRINWCPLPWHSLDKAFSKMVEGNSDLHILVLLVAITVSQEHDLVVVGHVIVWNSNGSGAMNGINKSVTAVRERTVINPNVASTKNRNSISIRQSPPAIVAWRVSHISIPTLLTIMYVQPMDDHIRHVLYRYAWPTSNVDARASAVDCLERVDHQLFLELDHHITLENDPQWLLLDDTVPKCAWLRVHGVVARVSHHVNLAVSAPDGVLTEPDRAVCQPLPVLLPIAVTPPAVINWVTCPTWEVPQIPPINWLIDAPAKKIKNLIIIIM